ncbi:MAG: DnaJ domain-containing protein [Nitrosomonas sp.]|nr:DnaJ domain-containing protein [Nitrosomonas sp.]
MDNRRNFYRILRVQPDATFDVIQQSYRSLMQKLRLHPDLGGEEHNARLINQAFAILRNPKLRATYDAKLLSQYNIKTLSSGGEFNSSAPPSEPHETPHTQKNKRNYYRVLNIQNDAESEIIQASYRVLSTQLTGKKLQLLTEAFTVVGDQIRRLQYDTLLRLHTHAASVEKLKNASSLEIQPVKGSAMTVSTTDCSNKTETYQEAAANKAYESIIEHYCQFCKTPYTHASFTGQERSCTECSSPLSSPADFFISAPRRSLPRIKQTKKADIYVHWPKNPTQVTLKDLSPTGLNFATKASLDIHQIIKVDAPHFKAIAQVAYCLSDQSTYRIGANFLTIEFHRTAGSFLSTSA